MAETGAENTNFHKRSAPSEASPRSRSVRRMGIVRPKSRGDNAYDGHQEEHLGGGCVERRDGAGERRRNGAGKIEVSVESRGLLGERGLADRPYDDRIGGRGRQGARLDG